jgi:hypothetical protein
VHQQGRSAHSPLSALWQSSWSVHPRTGKKPLPDADE